MHPTADSHLRYGIHQFAISDPGIQSLRSNINSPDQLAPGVVSPH